MDPSPLERFNETLTVTTPTILLGLVGGAVRLIVSKEHATPLGFIRGGVVACSVAVLVGGLLDDYGYEGNVKFALVGIAAFVADDILVGLLRLSALLRDNPREVLDIILRRR